MIILIKFFKKELILNLIKEDTLTGDGLSLINQRRLQCLQQIEEIIYTVV